MNRLAPITAYLGGLQDKFLKYQENRDVTQKLELAAQIKQADGIELCYPADFEDSALLKKTLQRFDLTVSSINFRSRRSGTWMRGSFTSEITREREEVGDDLKRAMNQAAELGCSLVTTCPLNDGSDTPFDIDYSKAYDYAAETLSRACSGDRQVRVSLEYKVSEPKTRCLFGNAGETLSFCLMTGIHNLGATLDFGHSILTYERPAQAAVMLANAKKLFHIHLNDNDTRGDWDLIPGSYHLWEYIEFFYTLKKIDQPQRWIAFDVMPKEIDPVHNFNTVIAMTRKLEEIAARVDKERIEKLLIERNPSDTISYLYSLI